MEFMKPRFQILAWKSAMIHFWLQIYCIF